MIHFSFKKLSDIVQSQLTSAFHQHQFQGISTDTRALQPGNLFIALKGEHYDGHAFLNEAHQKGAAAAIVTQKTDAPLLQLAVPDTVKALGLLAHEWRKQFQIPVVALTGSNGKTTLKNMVAAILRAACYPQENAVLATEANFNNHIGVPLLLSQLHAAHRYSVVEMGMNHFGELAYLTQLACPTVAAINNAAPAHLQGVSDIAGVAKAKGEIFSGLSPTGTAILNADDDYFSYWKNLIGSRAVLSFGLNNNADIHAALHAESGPMKQNFTLITPHGRIPVSLPLLGKHNVMNALAAATVCIALKIDLEAIRHGLELIVPAKGRLERYTLAQNICLIDDTYNANPASLQAAVRVLSNFSGNKILILGDMRELGNQSFEQHAAMGEIIQTAGIHHLFTYGEFSEQTSKNFGSNAHHFHNQEQLIETVKSYLTPHSTVLVKGSRYMKMEKVVAAIKNMVTVQT